MKHFLLTVTALLGLSLSACWFTADNFNGNYIAGANDYHAHYTETSGISTATYHNGMSTSLPLTVFVKVSPRFPDQPGEGTGAKNVIKAVLQYKVKHDGRWGGWRTVKVLKDLDWTMNFNRPVSLFGRKSINPPGLVAGDEILLRLYLTDGIYETGDLQTDITSPVPDTATQASGGSYEGGWSAPFVFRLVFNGNYY